METNDCPFKSADELGLSQAERDALIKTLILMENNAMVHAFSGMEDVHEDQYAFNMNTWNERHPCGTVCCIGGTAEVVGDLPYLSLSDTSNRLRNRGNPNLRHLFFSYAGDISPRGAAKALRGYLTTGKTKWE